MDTPGPRAYEFHVDDHLDDHWASWFGNLMIIRHLDGTTTLTGPITDQSHLHGVLAALRDSGTTLLSVQLITDADGQK